MGHANVQSEHPHRPNFGKWSEKRWGLGWRYILKCTKCNFGSPEYKLWVEVVSNRLGPNAAGTNLQQPNNTPTITLLHECCSTMQIIHSKGLKWLATKYKYCARGRCKINKLSEDDRYVQQNVLWDMQMLNRSTPADQTLENAVTKDGGQAGDTNWSAQSALLFHHINYRKKLQTWNKCCWNQSTTTQYDQQLFGDYFAPWMLFHHADHPFKRSQIFSVMQ